MSHAFGLTIESLVAVLLVVTIVYCTLLNRRLKRLKADEQSMRAMIGELITATEIAERAIGSLKLTVRECDEGLGAQLQSGAALSAKLSKQVASGEEVVNRLAQIALAARPSRAEAVDEDAEAELDEIETPAPVVSRARSANAKALLAAAQAFSERQRVSGLAA